MLAVGEPSCRPSFCPCRTRPLRLKGRPRRRSARCRSPSARAWRTRVLLTRTPSSSTVAAASTVNPARDWRSPGRRSHRSGRSRNGNRRPLQVPHRQSIDQDLADELGCRQLAQAAVEGQAEHHVDALPTQQLEFLAQAGQTHRRRIGEKNSRGCGSKITTQLGTPSSSERSRRRARIAWCPRWTPSKLPMVATRPAGAAGCVVREAAA